MYSICSADNRMTVGSASYHHTLEEGRRTLPSQQWGTLCLCSQYPLHSQGKEDQEESHNQMESSQIIPKMGWKPKTER